MPTLRQKQSIFAELVGRLIGHAYRQGFEITLGETYRTKEQAEWYAARGMGIVNSLHTQRLAIDLNLFRNGRYLTTVEAYRPLGEWWERLSTKDYTCCWGGRFRPPDALHLSIAHDGRR